MNNLREKIEWLWMYIRSRGTGTLMAYASMPSFIIGGILLSTIGPYRARPIDNFGVGLLFTSLGLPGLVIFLRKEWPKFFFISPLLGIPAMIGGIIWMGFGFGMGLWALWQAMVGWLFSD